MSRGQKRCLPRQRRGAGDIGHQPAPGVLAKGRPAGPGAPDCEGQLRNEPKGDRELLAQAYFAGKILGWWRDRQHRGFAVQLPDGRIGRIRVSRVAEALATLPERGRRLRTPAGGEVEL